MAPHRVGRGAGRVDLRRGERKRGPVTMAKLFETLKEAAVDEDPMVAEIEQMF